MSHSVNNRGQHVLPDQPRECGRGTSARCCLCIHWLRYGRIECHKFVDMEEMTLKELREKLVDNEMLRFLDERRTLARDSICLACYIYRSSVSLSVTRVDRGTRKLCYRKDDRAMRAI